MKKEIDTRLSYSSGNLLLNCTEKYAHHKLYNTPKDVDADDDRTALNVGSAFHMVLEQGRYETPDTELIERACETFGVVESMGLVHAMVLKQLKLHKRSGLKLKAAEFALSNDIFVGFVDAVMVDAKGGWWIVDQKTSARFNELLTARLHSDTQLNLYASFRDDIAKIFGLKPEKFLGCRYRVTTKSSAKPQGGESYEDYVKRVFKAIECYDVIIPKKVLNPTRAYKKHVEAHKLSMALRSGKVKPVQNFSFCDSFFKPCEWWSRCHGDTATNCKTKVTVVST